MCGQIIFLCFGSNNKYHSQSFTVSRDIAIVWRLEVAFVEFMFPFLWS